MEIIWTTGAAELQIETGSKLVIPGGYDRDGHATTQQCQTGFKVDDTWRL